MDDIDRRTAADKANEGEGRRRAARAGERRAVKGKVQPTPQEAVALAALDDTQRAELGEAEAEDKARAEIADEPSNAK